MRKILVNAQKCKIDPKKYHFEKFLVYLKASQRSQLGHFLFYCPFKGGHFSSVDLEMGVHLRLREVSAYGRQKCRVLVEKLP